MGQFSLADSVITFETGSTALPGIAGLHLSGGDSTFTTAGFGSQIFGNFNNSSYLDISFDNPVQAVGAYIVNDNFSATSNGVTEVIYDQANNILESESANFSSPGVKPPPFFGIGLGGTQIYKVEWRYFTPVYFGVDNVVYGNAIVPEPSSLVLLSVGGLLLVRRRKKI